MRLRLASSIVRGGRRSPWCAATVLAVAASIAAAHPATGQARITGRVVDAEAGVGIAGATVQLLARDGHLVGEVSTGTDGRFAVPGVAPGRYQVLIKAFAFQPVRLEPVVVSASDLELTTVALAPFAPQLGAIVVTASRGAENLLDAPAPVQIVDLQAVSERPALTVADHLRSLAGIDIVTIGLTQHSIVARGFNNVSSGTLFQLIDHRWASIPSLRFNTYNLVPVANDDIDHIEFVLGPGSALYGPNVDRGVMHIVTRSPLDAQGSVLSVTGGMRGAQRGEPQGLLGRGMVELSGRHAGRLGERTAVKLSGLYFSGNDWQHTDPQEVLARQNAIRAGADPDTLRIGRRNFETGRWALDGRLDTYVGERAVVTVSGGVAHLLRSVELTPVGAAQGEDWTYTYLQTHLRSGDFFAQSYVNLSDAGKSFLLRDGNAIVDNSYLWVGQVQHATDVGPRQRFQYGADLVRTVPRTDGTISGIHEDDDALTELGGYVQSQTELTGALTLIAAGRLDWHNRVNGVVFSPRAAMLIRPSDFHTFRLTYNRAFSQPSTQNLSLDISSSPSLGPFTGFGVRAAGVPYRTGFTFRRDCAGAGLCMYSPFNADPTAPLPIDVTPYWQDAVTGFAEVTRQFTGSPLDPALDATLRGLDPRGAVRTVLRKLDVRSQEWGAALAPERAVADIRPIEPSITNTVELGFKGFVPPRVFLSVDLYATRVENFIGPLAIETPNAFLDPASLEAFLAPQLEPLGLDSTEIGRVAQGLASVPLATVSPREAPGRPTDVYVTFRNFGEVELWGADLAAAIPLSERVELGAAYSYMSKNFFRDVDGIDDIALNAPRHKGSAFLRYRAARGFSAELRGRRVGRFDVRSGVFDGPIDGYTLVDLNVNYPLPFLSRGTLTATALNVLDHRHHEIVGAPEIGRMVYLRLTHSF